MNYYRLCFFAFLLVFGVVLLEVTDGDQTGDVAFGATSYNLTGDVGFGDTYSVVWGNDHVSFLDQGREVLLSLDERSGSGFVSKLHYESGFFSMRIKLHNKDSAGVVTAFYLTSNSNSHDELDFEFLGNLEGQPINLQTNVFANGEGNREQKIRLWFDPSADFHTYKILWNYRHIVFYVDDIPIRVFKNNKKIGVMYPTEPMRIQGSLWNATWATNGGRTQVNWAHSPFTARFQGFNIDGCPASSHDCYASNYWWNQRKYWNLNKNQKREYKKIRDKFMFYDYCIDTTRHSVTPPECESNAK